MPTTSETASLPPSVDAAARRSLRRSLDRRAAARQARRRRLTRRGSVLVIAGVMAAGSAGAVAADRAGGAQPGRSASPVAAVQHALGITADGVAGPQTRRAIRAFQRRNGLVVDGIIGPRTLAALGIEPGARSATPRPRRPSAPKSSPSAALRRIAACESGGDPTAISANGLYRGKYQFSRATWRAMGGKGDPAAAPEARQDRIAAKLYAAQGASPWPSCGR